MYCPKCGKENPDGTNFCRSCGGNVGILAPSFPPSPTTIGSDSMTFGKSISTCFSKFFNFSGRASRPEYWWFYLFVVLLGWGASVVDKSQVLSILVNLVLLVPTVAAGTRRLQDTNRSGWWQLLYFTIIGAIPVIIWMSSKGNEHDNEYGSPI
jgi:uncharacterized membrane protein YhaH (DUF805 family)